MLDILTALELEAQKVLEQNSSVTLNRPVLNDETKLEELKRTWLGKDGHIKNLFKKLGSLSSEERPKVAERVNSLRDKIEAFTRDSEQLLKNRLLKDKLQSEFVDLSLPSLSPGRGSIHPITRVERQVAQLLRHFGVRVVYGPEIETEYFCFDSLNVPLHHPARDMQDTFYTVTGHLLRTHTSSVQTRTLKRREPLPLKICCPGKVYRNETIDASHTAMFHQIELLWVGENLTLSQLMGLLSLVAHELYGKRRKIRFKPKYYPYTEPSIGLDIACSMCSAAGCSFCGGSGWTTVVGAGMVHRHVIEEFGHDPNKVNGFAFGFGSTRLAAQQTNLPRGKMLYEGDLRIMGQI